MLGGCGSDEPATTIDLIERLPFAEVAAEVETLDFGTPEARLHLGDGWEANDGRWLKRIPFVWGVGEGSTVVLPAYGRDPRLLTFRCRPNPPRNGRPQTLTVEFNGMYLGRLELQPGWRTHRVDVPARAVRYGDNVVTFRYGIGWEALGAEGVNLRRLVVAWDELRFRPADAESDAAAAADGDDAGASQDEGDGGTGEPEAEGGEGTVDPATEGDEAERQMSRPDRARVVAEGRELRIPFRSRISFHEEIAAEPGPEGRRPSLAIEALRHRGDAAPRPGDRLLVRLRDDSGAVVEGELRPGEGPWTLYVPDSATPYRIVEISLAALGGDGADEGGLTVVGPRLVVPGTGGAPIRDRSAGATDPEAGNGAPTSAPRFAGANVLVYLIDTLRSDHLGAYGYDRDTSPSIDELARAGVVFDRALAQTSWTRPAVASIFTGLDPLAHGTVTRDDSLDRGAESIAKLFREAGYETSAVTTNGNVAPAFGFDEGFERFEFLSEQRTRQIHRLSDEVNQVLLPWLRERGSDRPFFLYVHTTDPHAPYTPPSPYRERFAPSIRHPELIMPLQLFREHRTLDGVDLGVVRDDFVDLYDGEIAFNDANFGDLIAELRRLGLYDETLIVVLSDHGEEFLDHGGWAHGKTLYGEQLRVPLIVKFPGGWKAGTRVDGIARHVDLLPTLLDAVDLEPPEGIDGTSLMPALVGRRGDAGTAGSEGPEPRRSFAHLDLDGRLFHSLTTPEHHLIAGRLTPHRAAQIQLFDVASDPAQLHNLAEEVPVRAGWLSTLLRRWRFTTEIRLSPSRVEVDEELRDRLRALGYIQ